jgi:hypothetical protein
MNDPYFDLDRTNKEYDLYAFKGRQADISFKVFTSLCHLSLGLWCL